MKRLILIGLLSVPMALMAQVTLKPYTEQGRQGYKSIVFEKVLGKNADGTDRKEQVEFNIQANNPFNRLSYTSNRKAPNGGNIYELTSSDLPQKLKKYTNTGKIVVSSNYSISNRNKNALAVTYNLTHNLDGDILMEGRESEIVVVKEGEQIARLHLNSDAHDVHLSPNNKYVVFRINEHTEHELSDANGFQIYSVRTKSLFYQKTQEVINVSEYFGVISIACEAANGGVDLYCLSDNSDNLYYRNFPDRVAPIDVKDGNSVIQSGIEYNFQQDFSRLR